MVLKVAVLGATGLVGQRFVSLLSKHPWFELSAVTASERSVGMRYGDAVSWVLGHEVPHNARDLEVLPNDSRLLIDEGIELAFSALPSDVAAHIEISMLRAGINLVSNSSNFRMEPDVPLINPEVNLDHLKLLELQVRRGWKGYLAKVPNCSTAILTLPLKALSDSFRIKKVYVTTMQAVTGAGLRGVPSVSILGNVIPFIKGEEEKLSRESSKILGSLIDKSIVPWDAKVVANCSRVPVVDGHLESVFLELEDSVRVRDAVKVLERFKGLTEGLSLPSAPERPIIVRREEDRPQPRLDVLEGNGMSVVVGRVRSDAEANTLKFFVLGHNTIRGAAGTGILIAEAMVRKGFI
jgi:aspartate-semialdehyde dehydrogenase